MPTQTKRPSSSPVRRAEVERLALAALETFLNGGTRFSEIAVEAIAAQAGISRSTFYLYFQDKTELLVGATNWLKDLVFEERLERQPDGSLGELDTYIQSLEQIIARYRQHSALLSAVNQVAEFDDRVGARWLASQTRYISWVAEILREEQRRGLTADTFDADLAAAILITGGEHVIAQHVARTDADQDARLARELGTAQWFGFFRRPA